MDDHTIYHASQKPAPVAAEQLAALLKAFEVADGHAVRKKSLLDGVERVYERAVGIEDDQSCGTCVHDHRHSV